MSLTYIYNATQSNLHPSEIMPNIADDLAKKGLTGLTYAVREDKHYASVRNKSRELVAVVKLAGWRSGGSVSSSPVVTRLVFA